jgi:hypothetical protein
MEEEKKELEVKKIEEQGVYIVPMTLLYACP